MTREPKIYGVSFGNGNNGISHMFPDYYVRTDNPWSLAHLAVIATFKPAAQRWTDDSLYVDGEAEYGISAMLYDPPADTADGFPAESDDDESDDDESDDEGSWGDTNGAWLICEVFPVEDTENLLTAMTTYPESSGFYGGYEGRPLYGSIVDAIGAKTLIAWGIKR